MMSDTLTTGDTMRLPSVKTLATITTVDKAKELRELFEKKRKTRDYRSVQEWCKQCFYDPRYNERLLCACNEILEGYGVEVIYRREGDLNPKYAYVNTGDAYTPTLIQDCETSQLFVSDWGSIVERWN